MKLKLNSQSNFCFKNSLNGKFQITRYDPSGKFLAVVLPDEFILLCFIVFIRTTIYNTNTHEKVQTLTLKGVQEIKFSPLGTYIMTWKLPSKIILSIDYL